MNLLTKFFVFFLLFSGLCFAQTAPKPKNAQQKSAATPASEPASKALETQEETIPPAAPNALFPAVVARANGKAILGRDLERLVRSELMQIGNPEWKNLREEYRGQLVLNSITSLINLNLIYQKALASGVKATDAQVQEELQRISKSFKNDAEMNIFLASQQMDRASMEKELYQTIAINKYIEENVNKKITVTQDEITKYYTGHPKDFEHAEEVKVSHILIRPAGDTQEQDSAAKLRAEELWARIQKGEDFTKLAKENSMDDSASDGGDVGFIEKDKAAPEFMDAFALSVGGTKIIKTSAGYHILKVTEKKKEGLYTLDEVKGQLSDFLKKDKIQTELTKLVNGLRNEAKIEFLIPAGQPMTP